MQTTVQVYSRFWCALQKQSMRESTNDCPDKAPLETTNDMRSSDCTRRVLVLRCKSHHRGKVYNFSKVMTGREISIYAVDRGSAKLWPAT